MKREPKWLQHLKREDELAKARLEALERLYILAADPDADGRSEILQAARTALDALWASAFAWSVPQQQEKVKP